MSVWAGMASAELKPGRNFAPIAARNSRPGLITLSAASHARAHKTALQAEARASAERGKLHRQAINNWNGRAFEIASDPSGDFAIGARLSDLDLKYGLSERALPIGAVIHNRYTDERLIISERPDKSLALIALQCES